MQEPPTDFTLIEYDDPNEPNPYDQARLDAVLFRMGGAPAASAAAWISAIDKAERDKKPVPSWYELEKIAPSI